MPVRGTVVSRERVDSIHELNCSGLPVSGGCLSMRHGHEGTSGVESDADMPRVGLELEWKGCSAYEGARYAEG